MKSEILAKKKRGKPGRPKNSESSILDNPRERLLSEAIKVFSQFGYEAVSTGDVARAAHVSQPMVYYHFGSKELLWKAAIGHLMGDLARRFPMNIIDLQDLDPVSQLKVITRRFIWMSAKDPALSMVIAHESLARTERLIWLVEKYVYNGFSRFDSTIEAGIEKGVIKNIPLYLLTNTIVTASSFTFAVPALVNESYDVDITEDERIKEMADGIIEILFHGLVCQKPTDKSTNV